LQPIRIKLSATSVVHILTDKVPRIRKAVQILDLLRYGVPRREAFSLLLKQPFQARHHTLEQISELPITEGP